MTSLIKQLVWSNLVGNLGDRSGRVDLIGSVDVALAAISAALSPISRLYYLLNVCNCCNEF